MTRRLLLVVVLASCRREGDPVERLESSLRHRLEKRGIIAQVKCPAFEPAPGVAVACTATGAGPEFPVDVTLRDASGTALDWKIRGTVVDTRQLGRDIAAQRRSWGVLGCDHPRVVMTPGATITCALFDDGKAQHLAITATGDPARPFRWNVVP